MVVNDFNRTASLDHEKGKKGATAGKEFRKEEARRFFPFFDTKIGRPSRVESREMRRIVRIQLVECTWHTHLRVASEKRWIYYAPERRSLDSVPPDLTRIPCSTLFDRRGWIMVKDGYIENEFGSIDLNSFEFVMRE